MVRRFKEKQKDRVADILKQDEITSYTYYLSKGDLFNKLPWFENKDLCSDVNRQIANYSLPLSVPPALKVNS